MRSDNRLQMLEPVKAIGRRSAAIDPLTPGMRFQEDLGRRQMTPAPVSQLTDPSLLGKMRILKLCRESLHCTATVYES